MEMGKGLETSPVEVKIWGAHSVLLKKEAVQDDFTVTFM